MREDFQKKVQQGRSHCHHAESGEKKQQQKQRSLFVISCRGRLSSRFFTAYHPDSCVNVVVVVVVFGQELFWS